MPVSVPIIKKIPALKLFLSLAIGIIIQWYAPVEVELLWILFSLFITLILLYSFLKDNFKYRLHLYLGLIIQLLLISLGALLVWLHDIRNDKKWIGNFNLENAFIVATIEEPLVEKANSYKANASFKKIYRNDSFINVSGQLIFYFKKDSFTKQLTYGSQILFYRNLQEIKNSGNPGAFDYKRFCLFEGITHQAYLTPQDFKILTGDDKKAFTNFIYQTRKWVVQNLKKNIPGQKEQGLAEALLIGYKDDLDKNLVQAYSNTGVVHIIAISGLHLGIIYWLLMQLTKPLKKRKKLHLARLIIVLSSLWLFAILAGAQPSVIRAAVMFTFIGVSEVLSRKTTIYNTMALSAFLLLCFNPFWLWDVGFQLSYAAVLSIIIFFKPINNWFYPPNMVIDYLWKLASVTLSAQIFTLPISIYHFHQMPLLFLFSNIVAVPLATAVLIGEVILSLIFFIPPLASLIGNILGHFIMFMNWHIERMDKVSFAVWDNLYISIPQAILLLIAIASISYWFMEKKMFGLRLCIVSVVIFMAIRTMQLIDANNQKKLIVYNVPKYQAIDIIEGRKYTYVGDGEVMTNDFLKNFHIKPSRVMHKLIEGTSADDEINSLNFYSLDVMIINSEISLSSSDEKKNVDIIILSKNPRLYISNLLKKYITSQIVIDGSVPSWKSSLWKKDCDSLGVPCYDVAEKGAFVMNVQ